MARRSKAQVDVKVDVEADLAKLGEVINGTFEVWRQLHEAAVGGDKKAQIHVHKHAEILSKLIKTRVKLVTSDQSMPAGMIRIKKETDIDVSEVAALVKALRDVASGVEGVAEDLP